MTAKRQEADIFSIDTYLPHFFDFAVECPYGMPETAVYRQQQFVSMPDALFGQFLAAGFRRNGNTIYTMVCPDCSSCVPIRLDPARFRPNRNQKRAISRNSDVDLTLGPLRITEEKLALCGKFLQQRYPREDSSPVGYYGSFFASSITTTLEIEYRIRGRLLGTAVVDVAADWLNAVYFYFDPAEAKRSPGTFNILCLIDFCRENNIGHLYLGYLIREVGAMRYKENFKPHSLLLKGQWIDSDHESHLS